jgi:putative FmdB family regulatory protein
MPIYEYDCPVCGRFEVIQKVEERPLRLCPTCAGKGSRHRVFRAVSAAAFHLKGSGWYKTDYAGKSSGTNGSSKNGSSAGKEKPAGETPAAAAPKPESKPETKPSASA